ncbi:MAG: gamma-glutamyltransferase family protein, partial [Pseudomonadota bacterium]
GLAGGAFMLFYDASTGTITAYDGREEAPSSVTPDVFIKEDGNPMGFFEAVLSGKAVGVPGAVAMLDMAHREHGELEWNQLFEAPERLASEGFPMPERLHNTLGRLRDFRNDPQAAIYLDDEGAPLSIGTTVQNEPFAETIRMLAQEGASTFYTGAVAEAIIERVNAKTGEETITREDFAAYEPIQREPLCAPVADQTVCSMPPPSSGGITMLQILKLFENVTDGEKPTDDLLAYVEATRLAYADRGRYLGDPIAMGTESLPADRLIDALISKPYLDARATQIGSSPAETINPGNPSSALMIREGFIDGDAYEVPSTSHFSIRDRNGNIVSMTTSVEMPFGSQMMAAGLVLNNQLTDFARVPSDDGVPAANAPGPGKRPMSSMTPVITLGADGEPRVAIGSPGGPAIIGYVAKPLASHLFASVPLSEAIAEPHVVVPRGTVTVETGGDDLKAELEAMGYEVRQRGLSSGLYGFSVDGADVDLIVDTRREGSAKMESQKFSDLERL